MIEEIRPAVLEDIPLMSDWNMYDTLSEVKINNNTKVILLGNVTMWFIGLQFHFISPPPKKKKRNTAP